jgi:hypothetical protein
MTKRPVHAPARLRLVTVGLAVAAALTAGLSATAAVAESGHGPAAVVVADATPTTTPGQVTPDEWNSTGS